MQKIIALCGRGNSGKTHTLIRLINLLAHNGEIISINGRIRDGYGQIVNINGNQIDIQANGDIRASFLYRGRIVAVCTGGDTVDIIEANCKFFTQQRCSIAITATKSRGETRKELKKYATTVGIKKVEYKPKATTNNPSQYGAVNQQQAQAIFAMLP